MTRAQLHLVAVNRSKSRGSGSIAFAIRCTVIGWVVCLALAGLKSSGAHAEQGDAAKPTVVPGPWGRVVDRAGPLILTTRAERITRLRRQQMRALSAHYRSAEAVISYQAPYRQQLANDADQLVKLGGGLANMFAENSPAPDGKKGASAVIWADPERFAKHVAGFNRAASALAKAVGGGSGESEALVGVRHQCLACHREFRRRRSR